MQFPRNASRERNTREDQYPELVTYPLLGELTSSLVLSVSQKFDDTTLIRGKTDNLAGDVTDEGSAAGRLALGAADPGLGGVERGGFLSWEPKSASLKLFLISITQVECFRSIFVKSGPISSVGVSFVVPFPPCREKLCLLTIRQYVPSIFMFRILNTNHSRSTGQIPTGNILFLGKRERDTTYVALVQTDHDSGTFLRHLDGCDWGLATTVVAGREVVESTVVGVDRIAMEFAKFWLVARVGA